MKRTIKYLLMLICLITLSGCESNVTIKETRTIILDIDTEVNPSFASNFGSGSYNSETKQYTHTIDYLKDLYIFMSYDDLKTVTVHIPTSDMKEKTITKSVEFGKELDAEVEITVEGVKTLEGLQILGNLNYSNLKIGKKNSFKFTLPTRESDYNIRFTLPQYKEFNINLTEEDLVSGKIKVDTIALAVDQIYIALEGNQYEYKIYSQETNKIVSSGSNYENQSSTQYIVLPNTEAYYIKVNSNNGKSILKKINENENALFNVGVNNGYQSGYLLVTGEDEHTYYYTRLYNKDTKVLSNSNSIYGSIDSYGLLVKNDESGKWYYLSDLKNHVERDEYQWEIKYRVNFEDMIEVTFEVTRINYISKEIISNGIEAEPDIYYEVLADLNNNVFSYIIEEIDNGTLYVDLYSKEGEKISTIEEYIYGYFTGDIISGTVDYKGRTIPYVLPIFIEDVVFNNGVYYYPQQTIDTDISMLSIKFIDNNGDIHTLGYTDYIMDEEQEIIMGTQVGYYTYFELQEGKSYTFKYSNHNYSFTVEDEDVNAGYIFIINESIEKIQFKVPQEYYLIVQNLDNMEFYPDYNGIVSIPSIKNEGFRICISNGYVTSYEKYIDVQEDITYEFLPFYVIDGARLDFDENYTYEEKVASNGIMYYQINPYNNSTIEYLKTSAIKVESNGMWDYQKINLSDFTYNEEYKAYYYSFEEEYDHVLYFEEEYQMDWLEWSGEYFKTSYYDETLNKYIYIAYVMNETKIEYGYDESASEYTFTTSNGKYLKINLSNDGTNYQITIENINN